jgi:hypothetical protein
MENLRSRVDMRFITSNAEMSEKFKSVRPQTIDRTLASPLYNGHIIYDSDLAAVKMKKKVLVLNKGWVAIIVYLLFTLRFYRY